MICQPFRQRSHQMVVLPYALWAYLQCTRIRLMGD